MQQYLLCCDLGQENLTLTGSESSCAIARDRCYDTSMTSSVPACFPYMITLCFRERMAFTMSLGSV